jgi:hypothetical protein
MPRFRNSEIEKNTVLFEMEIQTRESKWYLSKKYSEFEQLNNNLCEFYHDLPEVSLAIKVVSVERHYFLQLFLLQ